MTNVLGPDRGPRLLRETLDKLGLELRTAHDLYELSEHLSRMKGFESAVGGLLGVAAILRGARPVERR